jgi:hypothetical protein
MDDRVTCLVLHEACRHTWYGRFLDDDGAGAGVLGDESCHRFKSYHVRCGAGSMPAALRWRVDRDQDYIGLAYGLSHLGCEHQIRTSCGNPGVPSVVGLTLPAGYPIVIGCGIALIGSRMGGFVGQSRVIVEGTLSRAIPGDA